MGRVRYLLYIRLHMKSLAHIYSKHILGSWKAGPCHLFSLLVCHNFENSLNNNELLTFGSGRALALDLWRESANVRTIIYSAFQPAYAFHGVSPLIHLQFKEMIFFDT